MKNIFSVILLLLLPSLVLIAQNQPLPGNKNALPDSVKIKYQKQLAAWEAERKKRETEAREAFLAELKIMNPDSVTRLNMKNLGLTELPDLSKFYRLKKIDASGNHIKHFKKQSFKSDSLSIVVLSGNPVKRICFPSGTHIKKLAMDNCNLKRIPCSIRKLKELHSLVLSKNQIRQVRSYVKRMEKLDELNLNFNRIEFNNKTVRRAGQIRRVLFAGNNISTLPDNIDVMTGVRSLNLADNNLSEVPDSFGRLDSLQTIIFYKNRFHQIPTVIFELSNLKELDFYYNNLRSVPDKFDRLPNLTRIYLSFNKLTNLPETMGSLKKLKSLYVHHNQLTTIPQWVTGLPNLTVLDAGFNQLISVPDLSIIKPLEEVDLQSNNLEDIPWPLLKKTGLRRIFLRNNVFIKDGEDMIKLKKLVKERAARGVNIYID